MKQLDELRALVSNLPPDGQDTAAAGSSLLDAIGKRMDAVESELAASKEKARGFIWESTVEEHIRIAHPVFLQLGEKLFLNGVIPHRQDRYSIQVWEPEKERSIIVPKRHIRFYVFDPPPAGTGLIGAEPL